MSRQMLVYVVAGVFLCPGGSNLIFGVQNSTPGGVGEPLCNIFSQIIVSRDQIFINFWCKMSICENSLLISFNSRIQIRVHFTRFEQCQVSMCENSFAKTFIFGFLEVFCVSFLYRFIVIICPEAKCRFVKPLQHFLLNLRLPDVSFQACSSMLFLYPNIISIESQLEVWISLNINL